jgi:formamidopyrimidine-DNA glycosylase
VSEAVNKARRALLDALAEGEPRGTTVALKVHARYERTCTRCGRRLVSQWGVADGAIVCTDVKRCQRTRDAVR